MRLTSPAGAWPAAGSIIIIIIIINPCKPYLYGIGTAPHPLGRRKVD
jgi:hypothetical protein